MAIGVFIIANGSLSALVIGLSQYCLTVCTIFYAFKSFSLCIVKIVTPYSTGFSLLAGPWWDSVTEKPKTLWKLFVATV